MFNPRKYLVPLILTSFVSILAGAREFTEMNPPRVLVADPSIQTVAVDMLRERGCNVTVVEQPSREEVLQKIKGMDGLLLVPPLRIDKELLDVAGEQLKTISTMSAGYNHIDLEELKARKIHLGNTPNVLNDAVADVAVLLTLAASRRLHEGRLKIEKNQWENACDWMLGRDIRNSIVGIVGLGGIGQAVVKKLKGFEVGQFLYTGHKEKPQGRELNAKFVPLDTLLRKSDFIIVCVPLTNETEGMFNDEVFAKMKKTAVFVNISRGKVVDQDALIRALKGGKIFAAGLDVMTPEPLPPGHELTTLPNVVLLPHLGSATNETRQAMAMLAATNLLRGIGGEELITPVV